MMLTAVLCAALAQVAASPAGDVKPELMKQRPVEGKLAVGEPAPDFNLKRTRSTQTVRLSKFKNSRPVALIFGSYT